MNDPRDRHLGCLLLGLATGDAVGTTVKYRLRGSFTPLTDMVGGGPFGLEAGEWTDDTSMLSASPRASSRREAPIRAIRSSGEVR
jgi:ADP-ribosyl-[dinitrogen reductase] hydrolase